MFLDVAVGIWTGLLVPEWFHVQSSLVWVFLGVCSALIPDIDLLFLWIFPRQSFVGRIVGGHHGLTHYPLVVLGTGLVVWTSLGPFFAALFCIPAVFHLLHDTFFLGWGIRWFWPFSMRSYKFFPDKDGRITSQFFWSWIPPEEGKIQKHWGTEDWVRKFYSRPSVVSWIEYPVFIVSVAVLVWWFL